MVLLGQEDPGSRGSQSGTNRALWLGLGDCRKREVLCWPEQRTNQPQLALPQPFSSFCHGLILASRQMSGSLFQKETHPASIFHLSVILNRAPSTLRAPARAHVCPCVNLHWCEQEPQICCLRLTFGEHWVSVPIGPWVKHKQTEKGPPVLKNPALPSK